MSRAAIPVLIGHPVRFLGERVTGATVWRRIVASMSFGLPEGGDEG